jgi:hypothetical protein
MQISLTANFSDAGEASTFMSALAEALTNLKAAFKAVVPIEPAAAEPAAPAGKPKRGPGRAPKAAEPAAAEPAVDEFNFDDDPPAAAPATVTVDDLRAVGNKLSAAHKPHVVANVLKEYGVARYSGIPQDKRAEALAKLQKEAEGL